MSENHQIPANTTVLVVEDEPDIVLVLRLWLVAAGFTVVEAQTGHDALSLLDELKPDVMILDLRLPDMDGWALLDRVREDERTRSVPIVIASAHAGGSTAQRALERDCGYVSKPFNPETILTAIAGRLGKHVHSLTKTGR